MNSFDFRNAHDKCEWMNGCLDAIIRIVPFIVALGLLLWFTTSCTTTTKAIEHEYIEQVDSINYNKVVDSIYHALMIKDSVYVHDSVFVKEKGDTIYIDRWHKQIEWHVKYDTLYKTHTDTMYVEYTTEVEDNTNKEIVKYKTSAWQKWMLVGGFMLAIWCIAYMLNKNNE